MNSYVYIVFMCTGLSLSRGQNCGLDYSSYTSEGVTQFKQFPFLGYINYLNATSKESLSKAFLISTKYALTTAANITPKFFKPLSVTFGDHCGKKTLQCLLGSKTNSFFSLKKICLCPNTLVTGEIKNTYPHPEYGLDEDYRHQHDIGLIEFTDAIRLTEYVQPICLPLDVLNVLSIKDGDKFYFCSHGDNGSDREHLSKRKTTVVPVINFQKCAASYKANRVILNRNSMLCAGDSEGDNCYSDSGAPLMLRNNGRWIAVAILSFGTKKCGSAEKPSVYTKVDYYSEWISNVINR